MKLRGKEKMSNFFHKYLKLILFLFVVPINVSFAGTGHKENAREEKVKPLKILTLGDSNGALPDGWVTQLKKIRANDSIFNISISGNTIGFDNNGRRSLNTLKNIRGYMEKAFSSMGKIDKIVIMLGTNDCKAVFRDSLDVATDNMRKLISEIKIFARDHKFKTEIYIVSPPPFGPDEMLEEKYKGGMERVKWLNKKLELVAAREKSIFINSCDILQPVFRMLTSDGVHLNAEGQRMIALIIQENLKY